MRRWMVLSLFVCGVAGAQSASTEAEALFRQGKKLMTDGKTAEACQAFDASQKLDPSVSTMLNQGACREKNGQLTTAWGIFVEAERQTRDANDDKSKTYNKIAHEHAGKLEARLSKLTITVKTKLPGLEIKRAGAAVDAALWNQALPVDGGTYEIVATAPQHESVTTSVTVANEGDSKTVAIPDLPASTAPVTPPVATMAPMPAPSTTVTASSGGGGGGSKVVPIAMGVAGLALIGGGIALELSASSTYDQAKLEPDDTKQASLWHSANTKRYSAEGLATAGVAAAGIAVWLFLRHGSSESSTTALAPVIDAHGGMLVFGGGF